MKFSICFSLAIAIGHQAFAQGTVLFNNFIPQLDWYPRVYGADQVTPVAGTGYLAELYAGLPGSSESSLSPVGSPVTFGTGINAGFFDQSLDLVRVISFAAPGAQINIQVRAWTANGGASWEEASTSGRSDVAWGWGNIFSISVGDANNPALMNNFSSFNVSNESIPEPSAVLLFSLGGLALVARRFRR